MNKFRNLLYRLASFLGDVNAVKKGKVGQRIVRKQVYKTGAKSVDKLLRDIMKW